MAFARVSLCGTDDTPPEYGAGNHTVSTRHLSYTSSYLPGEISKGV